MAELNEKQKRFAELYVQLGNAEEAARQAGYSARGNTTKLLQNTTVAAYIDELNQAIKKSTIASLEEVKEFLTETLRNPVEETKERLKAADMLNKTYGAYLDRKELSGEVGIRVEVDYGEDD
ncbi:terminase small subunit [Exiguobacterium sp. s21]|uniref:terminase small subunit n=1 Tax=Exiguobacterium sp. s21 TaxID=2751244 RepID=UPI001BE77815|nr:terminase small subunit [Exiguobacterium sp. s21]